MAYRAFVFDADPTVRRLVAEILQRRGYEVFAFAEGIPCHRCDGRACADVVMADLALANGSGAAFLAAQLAVGCANPHTAVTAASWSFADRAGLIELDYHSFQKPFATAELRAWLATVEATLAPDRTLSDAYLDLARGKWDRPDRADDDEEAQQSG